MSENLYTERYCIQHSEVNSTTKEVTLPKLLNILMKTAQNQVKSLKIGSSFINGVEMGWVVLQYIIHINRLPKSNESVILETRATSYNRYFAFREFWVKDTLGKVLVYIESMWGMIDLNNRKMISIPKEIIKHYHAKQVRHIPKLTAPQTFGNDIKVESFKKDYHVNYNYIDSNKHVNNAVYLKWMTDVLPNKFLNTYHPILVNLRFNIEVKFGDKVLSEAFIKDNNKKISTNQKIIVNNHIAALATCLWNKNET